MASEFLLVFGSILFAFFLGSGAMLLLGGKTTLHYIMVRLSRGTKILVWADTPTGRRSYVAKIEGDIKEGVASWKYRKSEKLTEFKAKNVGRFFGVPYIGTNTEESLVSYDLTKLGEVPRKKIDNATYNNILKRALTKPSLDDDLVKKIKLLLILVAIVGLIGLFVAFKVGSIETVVNNLGVV